mgnify:CR=1 FL=1
MFEQADFAIGSLGRHRSGITHIKTLKNREYAARGLAFTYSETRRTILTKTALHLESYHQMNHLLIFNS